MRLRTDKKLRETFYRLYTALFQAKTECPSDFHFGKLTTIHTAIMALEGEGWRVIGITPEALALLSKHDFRKEKVPRRLCRGHIADRNTTTKTLFDRDQPLGIEEFFELFLKNDKTVIMLNEQNKKADVFPAFIPIDNPSCELFPNARLVAWKHGQTERDFLRALHAAKTERLIEHEVAESDRREMPIGDQYDGDLDEDEAIVDAAWNELRKQGDIK